MLAFRRFWGKNALETLVELPVILPPSVAGLGLLMAFGRRGLLGPLLEELFGWRIPFTMAAVVLAQTFVALPFYVRAGQLGFQAIDPELQNAARVDGASALARFVYITLPLARRALLAGLLMSWARALGEFGATILFAGSLSGRTQTLSLLIYNIFEQDIGAAVWTALLMIALAAGLLVLARILAGAERST
jgi:molybdate transport system permease protein